MITALSTVALLASATFATAERSASLSKRGWSDIVWQGWGPTGVDSPENPFDARSPDTSNGTWWHLKNGGPGVGLNPGSKVGWRLRADHGNEVVFHLANPTDENPILVANYTGSGQSEDEKPAGIQHFATVGHAIFTASESDGASVKDIYDDTDGFQPIGWNISLSVENGCQTPKTLTVTVTHADGTNQTGTGTDDVQLNLAGPLPANVTVVSKEFPDSVVTLTYYNFTGLTWKVAAGKTEPTVPAPTLDSSVFWCDID